MPVVIDSSMFRCGIGKFNSNYFSVSFDLWKCMGVSGLLIMEIICSMS